MAKKSESIDQITSRELSVSDLESKIFKLEKEREKLKGQIEQYNSREKSTARALVLYERKIAYIKTTAMHDISVTCRKMQYDIDRYEQICENLANSSTRNQFKAYVEIFGEYLEEFKHIAEELEENSLMSNHERAYISGKLEEEKAEKSQEQETGDELSLRFARLKQEFNEKVGDSVTRGRGRPKRDEESIVSKIGLGSSGKSNAESEEASRKLNEIFYEAPKTAKAVSNIPNTKDSVFDFDEALNPNLSLKEIMDDLMEQKDETETPKYFSHIEKSENKGSVEERDKRRERVANLEAGIFQKPVFKEKEINKTEIQEEKEKTPTFEDRFMPFRNIMSETKK